MISSFLLIASLLFSSFNSDVLSPAPQTCDSIHMLVGGDSVQWIDYPEGWDLPADLKKVTRVDFDNGGVWEYYSRSEQARYIWVFTSYDRTTDAKGEHFGAHEFCGPYRVSDG